MALYQLKMHRLEREGHRPKQGEGGQDVGEKNQNHSFTLRRKFTESWETYEI